ncbi:AbrB/MazE/SpoVT family DNA-binding domain-containing protein [Marasmitruncus massiliensis]|uniref:AbrB/MazE/SpoVT family DNA-binding domain-containing protein n=1 Tax=Marasmitruncus massiliensis TaxID=1944642 RepID=UPI000C79E239|nr:AbrB/MazE/SpoVT family DNA-binding domain-containing protein [Marasmitruncus massiliensis]
MINKQVDGQGRIAVPAELRHRLRIRGGDTVHMSIEEDSLRIEFPARRCAICGEREVNKLRRIEGKDICVSCLKRAKELE